MKRSGGKLVLSDVSFSVQRGEVFGILGPNGAGKPTTVEVRKACARATGV